MRKWFVPITVLGLSGLGVLLSTEKGRETARRLKQYVSDTPEHLSGLNDAVERELANLQQSVDSVAARLGVSRKQIAG
ncbi:MAG: hypothetical protein HYX26_08850 [Acidobacteriales bacterium]|nr:hypothetical protein [Terriglobales bacterium]